MYQDVLVSGIKPGQVAINQLAQSRVEVFRSGGGSACDGQFAGVVKDHVVIFLDNDVALTESELVHIRVKSDRCVAQFNAEHVMTKGRTAFFNRASAIEVIPHDSKHSRKVPDARAVIITQTDIVPVKDVAISEAGLEFISPVLMHVREVAEVSYRLGDFEINSPIVCVNCDPQPSDLFRIESQIRCNDRMQRAAWLKHVGY